jgi:hypothetical protein
LFAKAVFSKPPQELPLVALGQQEKISYGSTRLSIPIGARRLCFKRKSVYKVILMIYNIFCYI